MTPQQLSDVRRTGRSVLDQPGGFAASVYRRIFADAPDLRALFGDELEHQYHTLVDELTFLVHAASDLPRLVERARRLGHRHAGYGARAEHFAAMRAALLGALADAIGPQWDRDVAGAWAGLYDLVAETMLEGASDTLFAPPGRPGGGAPVSGRSACRDRGGRAPE